MPQPAASLSREQLRPLLQRTNGPGLVHLAVQSTLLLTSASATLALAQQGHWAWIVAVTVCGFAVALFFPSLHESGHKTAFASNWLNSATCWVSAILMLQAPSFFREFHWAHHRHTQDREHDPEISAAPEMLAAWPRNPVVYLALVSGQLLWSGKLMFTLSCAVLPTGLWERIYPFIRPPLRSRIAWESRFVVILLTAFVGLGLQYLPGFAELLLAWPIAHVVLGFYLMTEHTGLPHDGSQAHRTRSVRSSRGFEWLMWNMPYHAEHHSHPAVPFHALPALKDKLAPELEHEVAGYVRFHVGAIARAFAGGRVPTR